MENKEESTNDAGAFLLRGGKRMSLDREVS